MSDMKLINGDRKPLITIKFLRRRNEAIMKKCLKIFFVLLLSSPVFAAKKLHSLATKFSDVILAGMTPGMVYSLKKERNIPYTVVNYAESKRDIEVTIEKPSKSQLKENYEPVPDVSWVTVFPSRFSLESGEERDCDLIISIPPDEEYANRHYQTMIVSQSAGKPASGQTGIGLNFALASRLRFSTGPRPEKALNEYRQKVFAALNLEMTPMSLFLKQNLPVGERVLMDGFDHSTVQVVNKSRKKHKLALNIARDAENYGISGDYASVPPEVKLKIKKQKITSKARSFNDVVLEIEVPDKEEFYGKNYVFVVVGKVLGFDLPIEIFSRVYFKTEEKK
ncbi:hypothetical protein KJ633_00545 [bacterium]|nr:hypothetical protein [bacterium]MBU3954930.1 hypothetical protein [bacterium]